MLSASAERIISGSIITSAQTVCSLWQALVTFVRENYADAAYKIGPVVLACEYLVTGALIGECLQE